MKMINSKLGFLKNRGRILRLSLTLELINNRFMGIIFLEFLAILINKLLKLIQIMLEVIVLLLILLIFPKMTLWLHRPFIQWCKPMLIDLDTNRPNVMFPLL